MNSEFETEEGRLDLAIEGMMGRDGVGPEDLDEETLQLAQVAMLVSRSGEIEWPKTNPVRFPKEGTVMNAIWGLRKQVWVPVAVAAALLLVVGSGGYLLGVGRSSSNPGSGISYFVPQVGQGTNGGSGGTSTTIGGAPQTSGGNSPGVSSAPNNSGIYPYQFACQAQPNSTVNGHTVTANGFAEISPGGTTRTVFIVSISITNNNQNGISMTQLMAQVDAMVADLERDGVPRSSIASSFNSYYEVPLQGSGVGIVPNGAPVPQAAPATTGNASVSPSSIVNGNATGNIVAEITDPSLADSAAQVAAANGATSVSVNAQTSYPQPDSNQVQAATDAAVSEAHSLAAAAAQSAGASLGSVQSLVVTPPSSCGYGNFGPQTVVSVSVVYSIK